MHLCYTSVYNFDIIICFTGLNGFYIMVIGAMILVILTSLIFMCIIGISRYSTVSVVCTGIHKLVELWVRYIQKRRYRYDMKDDNDGYLL